MQVIFCLEGGHWLAVSKLQRSPRQRAEEALKNWVRENGKEGFKYMAADVLTDCHEVIKVAVARDTASSLFNVRMEGEPFLDRFYGPSILDRLRAFLRRPA